MRLCQTLGWSGFGGPVTRVHAPDLFEGRAFDTLDEGAAYAGEVGFGTLVERGRLAVGR